MIDKGYGLMPNHILFSKDLSDKQKLLFCYITSLCAERGYCRASNKYISENLDCKPKTISENISKLSKLGFIDVEVDIAAGNQRKVSLNSSIPIPKKQDTYTGKKRKTYTEKTGHNNTSNNNIKENTFSKEKEEETSLVLEEKKEYGDPEINECINIIKKFNNGIIDGTKGSQRQFGNHLVKKLKTIDSVLAGKFTRQQILGMIMEIVSKNEFHYTKITGPEKIFRNLAVLQQICRKEFSKPVDKLQKYIQMQSPEIQNMLNKKKERLKEIMKKEMTVEYAQNYVKEHCKN